MTARNAGASDRNFDAIASGYRWLEYATFGGFLHRCRTAFLPLPGDAKKLLVAGDGDGRFLAEVLRGHPAVESVAIDQSARMLELAQQRCQFSGTRSTFLRADLAEPGSAPVTDCDVVATHFFLDCFSARTLGAVMGELSRASPLARHWLVSEFRLPDGGISRLAGWMLVRLLQAFFRVVAGTSATELPTYEPLLRAEGYQLRDRKTMLRGLLVAEHWEREITS